MNYVQFPNGKIWPVSLDRVTANVEVSLDDLHDFDVNGLVNILHEQAIGAPALRNIKHTARHAKGGAVVFQVEAHVDWSAFAGKSWPKELAVHEVVQDYVTKLGWGKVEATHALESYGTEYGDELIVSEANGRELRIPVSGPCSYVRIVQEGFELMYWGAAEWASAPEEVMGAILGLAGQPVISRM